MKLIEKVYSDFFRMMEEQKIYEDSTIDFDAICRLLDVSVEEFNEFLLDELGFRGQEIIDRYRNIK